MANRKEGNIKRGVYYSIKGVSSNQKVLNEKHTQELRDLMNRELVSKQLLQWADNNDIKIRSDHQCGSYLYSCTEKKAIHVDTRISPSALVKLLARELTYYQVDYESPSVNISSRISQTSYLWRKNADLLVTETHSQGQKKDDKKRIQQIRQLMKKSPLGKQMLKWADSRDVKIYLDHQCKKSVGYHRSGTNSVCLNSRFKNNRLVETLAHELRHCWQDHNSLTNLGKQPFPHKQAIYIRFIEADAFAFGRCVGYEASLKTGMKSIGTDFFNKRAKQSLKKDPNALKNGAILSEFFELFFTPSPQRDRYDARSLKTTADFMGIINYRTANVIGEFTKVTTMRRGDQKLDFSKINFFDSGSEPCPNFNPYDEKKVRKLGDIFGQYNYLDHLKKTLSKDEKYLGNFAKEHKTLFKQIKHHKKMQKNKV